VDTSHTACKVSWWTPARNGLWCFMLLSQQYFSYIVAVNFIGGENQRTQEKTTDLYSKSLTNFITVSECCIMPTQQFFSNIMAKTI
jgi:hypothetical protein